MPSGTIKRAQDVPEGTYVKVLDDVPGSELTIGDEGIVVNRDGKKFLLTDEVEEVLPLSQVTPLEIVSAAVEQRREPVSSPLMTTTSRVTSSPPPPIVRETQAPPPRETEMEPEVRPRESAMDFGVPSEEPIPLEQQKPLTQDEADELEELTEISENGEELEPEERTRLQQLGVRFGRFGRAARDATVGAFSLGEAVARPAASGIMKRVQALQEPESRARVRRGLVSFREGVAERAEVPLIAAEYGLRGVAATETGAARAIRRLTGQQIRLSSVPAGALVRFADDSPEVDIFRGDEGIVQFGVRRQRRRVFFPSTDETVLADPNMHVTVLGRRTVSDPSRTSAGRRRTLGQEGSREDFERRFFQPRQPEGVTEAPQSFRPRLRERPPVEDEYIEPTPQREVIFPEIRLGF